MVTLVDTSVWVSFLRGDGSPAHTWFRRRIDDPSSIAVTEPVIMELLAGAGDARRRSRVEAIVMQVRCLTVQPDIDFRDAGLLSAAMRADGRTVRSIVDCLIATVALRTGVGVAHRDTDYRAIAGLTPLQTVDLLG